MNLSLRCVLAVACALMASALPLFSSSNDDLLAAATQGDGLGVSNALATGADVNARDRDGVTALMHAVASESFTATRELLWAGSDTRLKDRAGNSVADRLGETTDENLPLQLLVRSYLYLQTNTTRAKARPAALHRVLIMEDVVNYLHPKLKGAYTINESEAKGVAGKDDDQNGFVDDVYGWNAVLNRPYQIREAQLAAYTRHREEIARILKVDADRATGVIPPHDANKVLGEFTNPLSEIMGSIPGLSDGDFLNMVKDAAHGSHVAGIVLEASEGRAQLHTLAVAFTEESRRPLGAETDQFVDALVTSGKEPEEVLREFRARLLAHMTQRGRLASRYLQTSGAGVVNLSFGGGMGWWQGYAFRIARRTVDHLQNLDEDYPVDYDALEPLAIHWGREMYVANALEVALMAYENPDVLFCCAAGNEDANNDQLLTYPAYLSRFFPNVLTVASVGDGDRISSFSNYGVQSVNVSAPGENILSTVIPEASMYMNGTSMATPYVAGVAALVRFVAPELAAADLRRELEYTVRETTQLRIFTSSGGVVDKDTLRALHTGDPRAKSTAFARMAIITAQLDPHLYPQHQADGDRYAKKAIELDETNPEAWRARAAYFDLIGQPEEAWEFIEQATRLAPDSMMIAVSRTLILENRERFSEAITVLDTIIARLQAADTDDNLLSRRLAWRARLLLRVGRDDEALDDARAARERNESVQLPDELDALL